MKRQLKKFPLLVALKRGLWSLPVRILHGCDLRILEAFPLFAPFSTGSVSDRARLTVQAANQTFPFLVDLVSSFSGPVREPIPVAQLINDETKRRAAARLKVLFDAYGSDKSSAHDYHLLYGSILAEHGSAASVIEVGIGTNNTRVVSTIGARGRPGASLRAFRDFLPDASIYGADVDRGSLFEEERIKTFFVDQTDRGTFVSLSASIGCDFDLIIDDGLHSPNANIATLIFALSHLRPGGWLVVEDIFPAAVPVWQLISALLPDAYACQLIEAKGGFLFAMQQKGLGPR